MDFTGLSVLPYSSGSSYLRIGGLFTLVSEAFELCGGRLPRWSR
jgi:hypothetical protein